MVVKMKVTLQGREELDSSGEVAGIDQLVFERPPQPFDENIVGRATTAIHADQNAAFLERGQEFGGGELRALIGVPDFGLAETESPVECGQAEAALHGVGEFPTEHEAAEPIHHRDQVEKAAPHRDVSNICTPDMVGSKDFHATQQIWIDPVPRRRATEVRFSIVGFEAQDTHESLDSFAVYFQHDRHFATAEERALQIQLVEPAEQPQVLRALWPRLIIVTRTWHSQQFALLLNGQVRMCGVDPWTFVNRGGQLFF
jgi:hypothetical protein